ncbi:MAG: hypothetical protein ACQZ3N_00875 [cyanobacterium endosymbiont of Rhopalodia yunnanensis]
MVSTINTDLVVIEMKFESKINKFIINFNKKEILGIDFPNTKVIEKLAKIIINVVAANNFVGVGGI